MNSELLEMVTPEPTEEEVRAACRAKKNELGFDIEKAMFPHNPFNDAPLRETSLEDAIILAREFGTVWESVGASMVKSVRKSVRASVWESVRESVMDSVFYSVLESVEGSVGASVWPSVLESVRVSVWAYVSSIFFNVEKWDGIEHEVGVNPFQPSIDLWEAGYVPVYHDNKIQLYTKDGLVWEGE